MKRLDCYKKLRPGDVVYPGFPAKRSMSKKFYGMMIIGPGEAYQPHLVLSVVEDGPVSNYPEPDGRIMVLTDEGTIGYFSGQAVLYID